MVFNTRTRKVEENLHIKFLENKPNVARSRPDWLFDIDLLTNSMNYEPITVGNQNNKNAEDAVADDAGKKTNEELANEAELDNLLVQQKGGYANSTSRDSTVSPSVSTPGQNFTNADDLPTDPLMPDLEDSADLLNTGIFSGAYNDEDMGVEDDFNNLETTMNVSPIPTTRIHKDHPKDQIIGDINSATQTRRMTKISEEHVMIEAMQDDLLQFRSQKVWRLVDLPKGKHAIGTKWVYRNKKDERGILVRNMARLFAQGYTQEKGINYDEVFAPVARIEAIMLFLAYASFMGFIRYQMDAKSAFLYGTIEEELLEPDMRPCLPTYWKMDLEDALLIRLYSSRRTKKDDGIFISQDKYVADILKKFNFIIMKTTSTPIETNKALLKDEEAVDVDVHLYRSMIGSLMYLTASRPGIMFVVCACVWFQVTPKVSHLHDVKRIFRYLKGQSKFGLWYPKDSPFDLEAFSDSDYVGASLDRKSTTGGCQFLGKRDSYEKRLIQVIKIHTDHNVANLLTKAFDVSSIRDKFRNKSGSCKSRMDGRTCNIKQKCVKSQTPRQAKRGQDTKIPQSGGPFKKVGDEAVHNELGDRMEKATTTTSSLEAEQDSGGISSLEDSDGINTLPNTKIFEQLALMGSPIRQETEVPQLISPPDTNVADEDASTGVDVRHRWAATTVTSLDAGHGSGNINKTPLMPYDSPLLRGHTLGSDKGIMQQHELMDLVTKLSDRREALETDLRQTKKVYGDAFTRLIKKVKKLEQTVKISQARRRSRVVISDDEEEDLEDSSKQGRMIEEIVQDARVTLVTPIHSQEDQPEDYTGSGRVSTASRLFSTAEESVSTAGASMPVSTASSLFSTAEEERQRITRVHKEASFFNIEECEDIQATIEADEELA
ncbi:copia protein [Tanacetum coccineum]